MSSTNAGDCMILAWHERGGLVGRGVLLDYKAFADARGITYSPFESHAITVQDLEAVAHHQGTVFCPGDVLMVRTGFSEEIALLDEEKQEQILHHHHVCGIAGTEETARWVWNHRFAAVAADNLAFEVQPPLAGRHLGEFPKKRRSNLAISPRLG